MIVCTQCGNLIRKCQCKGQPEVVDTEKIPKASGLLCRALRQYRHNHDNSPDLFSPEHGFTHGYDKDIADEIVDGLIDQRDRYRALLDELHDYFDQRADADCEGDPLRYVPNEEMRWKDRIETALNGRQGDG